MKKLALVLVFVILGGAIPSCVAPALTAASSAAVLGENAGLSSLGLATLFNNSAPETLSGRVITFDGEYRGVENTAKKVTDVFSFNAEGSCQQRTGSSVQTLSYTRKSDKKATITSIGNATETYRLIFTSGSEGTYTFERRGQVGDFATGEGTFTIK